MADIFITNLGSAWAGGSSVYSMALGDEGWVFLAGADGRSGTSIPMVRAYKDGILQWESHIGNSSTVGEFRSLAYKDGSLYMVGGLKDSFDAASLGLQNFEKNKPANIAEPENNYYALLTKLNTSSGEVVFNKVFDSNVVGNSTMNVVHLDGSGNIYVSGTNIAGGDAVIKLNQNGEEIWRATGGQHLIATAEDGSTVALLGSELAISYDKDKNITSTIQGWLGKITGDTALLQFPNPHYQFYLHTAVLDSAGDIYFSYTKDDRTKNWKILEPGALSTLVVKLSGQDGSVIWTQDFKINDNDNLFSESSSINFDSFGNLLISGYTRGNLNGTESFGGVDGYVATLDPVTGEVSKLLIIGTPGDESASIALMDPANNLLIGGNFSSKYYSIENSGYQNIYLISEDGFTLMGDGQDNIIQGGNGSDTVNAGAGNDELNGGLGNDILNGGLGNDELAGGDGNDTVDAGIGNDLIIGGDGAGDDVYNGGTGIDTVKYTSALAGIKVNLSTTTGTATSITANDASHIGNDKLTGIENIIAGNFNDVLTGSSAANVIEGGAGKDTIDGGTGSDTADYSDKTSAVSVTLNGATAVPLKVNNIVEDTIKNTENIIGGSSSDTLIGDSLGNTFMGGAGSDTLNGGTGIDTADYSDKTSAVLVTLNGTTNATVSVGGTTEDTIKNIENIIGGSGDDTLTGDSLANVFRGGDGNDTLNGGAGIDTADYSDKTTSVSVTLNGATNASVTVGGTLEDTIKNIENIIGGSGNDSLTGDSLANALTGGDGNDTLRGAGGVDTLNGGAGSDTADFSDKSTAVVAALNGATQITVTVGGVADDKLVNIENLLGSSGNDSLTGDALANMLFGNAGSDTLNGAAGSDTINGGAGNDVLIGGAGNDAINGGDNVDTASFADKTSSVVITLSAGAGTATIGTGTETDTLTGIENLTGGSANDTLTGDDNNNQLVGGAGNDKLNGGTGKDTLTGGAGNDQFIFNTSLNGSTNLDTITDFTRGGDKLVLDDAIFAQLTAGVTAGNIVVGTTAALASRTYDANDYLMFNTTTKTLFYDATGMGGSDAVAFVQLTGVTTLAHTDFFIV